MKKLLISLLLVLPLGLAAQGEGAILSTQQAPAGVPQFPYSKLFTMTGDQLSAQKFKYDSNHNWEALKKSSNFLLSPADMVRMSDGHMIDIKPDVNDYLTLIQYGKEGIAYVQVLFYKDETYHELLAFAKEKGENLVETSTGNFEKITFTYAGYSFELSNRTCHLSSTQQKSVSTTTTRPTTVTSNKPASSTTTTTTQGQTVDQTYNIYQYFVYTGVEPSSPWLDKQAGKQQQRDDKGKKKQNASDLM